MEANFFTVAGTSTPATNPAGSGVVTATFPATASIGTIGTSALGGKVAYILKAGDDGFIAGEQRGLIATNADQSSSIIWAVAGYQSMKVPRGTKLFLGTGSSNTDNIISQNSTGDTYAAGIARACRDGGYTDWFLPSLHEIGEIYLNRIAVGGFNSNAYWSSSESSAGEATGKLFFIDYTFVDPKSNPYAVRAVRAF